MGTNADDIKGRAKIAAGAITGDDALEREGRTDRTVGKAKKNLGKASGKAQDLLDSGYRAASDLVDKARQSVESVIDKAKASKK